MKEKAKEFLFQRLPKGTKLVLEETGIIIDLMVDFAQHQEQPLFLKDWLKRYFWLSDKIKELQVLKQQYICEGEPTYPCVFSLRENRITRADVCNQCLDFIEVTKEIRTLKNEKVSLKLKLRNYAKR